MNYRRFLHGAKFWFWVALFVAYSAGAVGLLMIDTYEDRYRHLSKVELTTVKAQEDVRRAGASQVAAVYRAQSGMPFASLPAGSTFQVVWPDGSTETMVIVDPTSPNGVRPLAVKPTMTSFAVRTIRFRSLTASSSLSSAPSTALMNAPSPPAISPITVLKSTPKVGGHSEASSTPMRPLVPAPT